MKREEGFGRTALCPAVDAFSNHLTFLRPQVPYGRTDAVTRSLHGLFVTFPLMQFNPKT